MAVSLGWSSVQTEGQINRLKAIKRQMYGQASLNLLARRLLSGQASRTLAVP